MHGGRWITGDLDGSSLGRWVSSQCVPECKQNWVRNRDQALDVLMCCGRREDGKAGSSWWLSRKHSQLTCSWVRSEVVQLTLQ